MKRTTRHASHAYAECNSCGDGGLSDGVADRPGPMRLWAIQHATENPGHRVFHTVETSSTYMRTSPNIDPDRSSE